MTSVAVDWVTLPTPEFVAWTRLAEIGMPFPLNTGEQPYITGPDRSELERRLSARRLDGSAVLEATRGAFAEPRLIVYAVRIRLDGAEERYVAVAGQQDEHSVLVVLDSDRTAIRRVAPNELAASVVGGLPSLPLLAVPSAEVTVSALQAIDAGFASGQNSRLLHLEMVHAGLPPALIAFRERCGAAPALASGALGAMGFTPDVPLGRHSIRSVTWREYPDGGLLQIERRARQGEAIVLLTPAATGALFQGAVDAVSSVYEAGPQ